MSQPLPTIEAVRCVICSKLHEVSSDRYLKANIHIVRRRAIGNGRPIDESKTIHYGTTDIPAVICDNDSCIVKAVGGGE